MDEGWIKLHRSIMDHPLYHAEPFTRLQAWVDLLLLANIEARTMLVRGVRIAVERGQVVQSKDYLAGRWRWSRSKVKRYFRLLEDEGMIIQQNSTFISKITIVNFEKYQENGQRLTQRTTQRTTQQLTQAVNQVKTYGKSCESAENVKALENDEPSKRPTDEPLNEPKDEPKDDPQHKNNIIIEERKKIIYSPNNRARTRTRGGGEDFEAPKVEEVAAYAQEAHLKMDAAAFVDYYEARGWTVSNGPMKSWRAAARMWARKFAELKREKYLERKAREKAEAEREAERKQKEAEREAERQRKEAEREARYKRQDEEREAARQRKEAEREAARLAEQEARAAKRRAAAAQRRASGTSRPPGCTNRPLENSNRPTEISGSRLENSGGRVEINEEFTPNIESHEQPNIPPRARRDSRAAQLERERAERDAQLRELIARTLASGEA